MQNNNNRQRQPYSNEQTIILQDENGKELQRIVSARDPRSNLTNQVPTNAFEAPIPINTIPPVPYGMFSPMTPLPPVAPMTPALYQQPPPYYLSQPILNPMIATPGALSNQIILEEDENEYITNGTDIFRKVPSRAIVSPYPDPKIQEIDQVRKLRKKQDDYVYCCSFCEAPTNDTW
jgi:hypothetical protein